MTRLINPGKRLPDPSGEPDFYDIARRFPLPEDPHDDDTRRTDTEAHEQSLIEPNPGVYDSSRSAQAQAPPEVDPSPYLNRPPDKRQRRERHSFPPDRSNHGQGQGSGFDPQYEYPPSFGHEYYGHPHYSPHPMMYPPYPPPYNYYPGPYGNHWHHHNPYISPERHVPPHGYYSQQPWHPQPHPHSYGHQNVNVEREHYYDQQQQQQQQHIDQDNPQNIESAREPNQQYKSLGSEQVSNARRKSPYTHNTHIHHQDIHRGSGRMANEGTVGDYSSKPRTTGQRYVFPSYGASSERGPMYADSAANSKSANYMNESSNTDIEREPEIPAELDDRKPAAKMPSASTELNMTPVRNPQLHLEWTESFSKDVCNYLLEDDEKKKSTTSKKGEGQN